MNEEWNENSEMKANEDEEKYAMNEDWKARDRDAEQNEWKEMGTQLSKGEWMSKTDSQKPDCTSPSAAVSAISGPTNSQLHFGIEIQVSQTHWYHLKGVWVPAKSEWVD